MFADASVQTTTIYKRDGRLQTFNPLKVQRCLYSLTWSLDITLSDIKDVVDTLQTRLPGDIINAETFLIFLAETVSTFSSRHPDYSILAGRVYTSYQHRRVPKHFSSWVLSFENACPRVFTDDLLSVVRRHADFIDGCIMHHRDFDFSHHALQSFERAYLIKDSKELNERLQFLFMRTAIAIHGDDLDNVIQLYDLLSTRQISLAPTTLWNGALVLRHYSPSYVYQPFVADAHDTVASLTALSHMWSADGNVGITAGHLPATSNNSDPHHPGLLTTLKVYDALGAYWTRNTEPRTATATVYLPIWHADVRRFILCKTTRAKQRHRFHNLIPALWIPDLFMRRLESDGFWSLFDPAFARLLPSLYGTSFEKEYADLERLGVATAVLAARQLWDIITDAIRESGCPFIVYADNINARNNQMNLGVVQSANLSTELVLYSSTTETATCPLASLCLPRFRLSDGTFDYTELHTVTKFLVRSLDQIVDLTTYPTPDSAVSALRTRSLGIGVQGLADLFAYMELPFTSAEARLLNKRIYETIYHAALESSCELANDHGHHDAWIESPAHQGILQVDMWDTDTSSAYDFNTLRTQIARSGLRNSVLTAQMPTTSTAHLFGNSEGIHPVVSNVTHYRQVSGTVSEISRPMVAALQRRGLWTENIRNAILASRGSIQSISDFPDDLKAVFKTAFEIDQEDIIDMAVDRAPFVDQSQSLTLFLPTLTPQILMNLQLRAWRAGLKTGAYYVRTSSGSDHPPFALSTHPLKASPSTSLLSESSIYTDARMATDDS